MKNLFTLTVVSLLLLCSNHVVAQGTSINTTGAAADNSAMLDVNATNKGILIPRMDSAQIATITSPATGLLAYQTDGAVPGFYYYSGTAWKALSASATTSSFNDTLTDNLYTNGFLLSGDDTTGILMGSNGQLIDTGTSGSGSDLTISGAGTRLIWYPKLSAFRAGYVDAIEWDLSQIGIYSMATGFGTTAYGQASTAMGASTSAGDYSTAMGISSIASGSSCTAMGGYTHASGQTATAMGYETIASGDYSTAMSYSTTASGQYSTAMGNTTTASGGYSTAMGYYSIAGGNTATAMGNNTSASGDYSTAMGYYTTAGATFSTAMGYSTNASGDYSTAMGTSTTASGQYSTAMGNTTTADGDNSTAMGGYVGTGGWPGAFIIGDSYTASTLYSSNTDQMTMRFANGYNLFTADDASAGVSVSAGGGSWSSVSDRRKKTNFTTLDKEDMLMKVCAMPVTRWNYKSQPTAQKHVGPMAQDFYAAFQLDGIGNDTTINTTDIDGVNMIAIQALEKRTEELKAENDALKALLAKQQLSFDERMNKVEAMLTRKDDVQKLSVK